MDLTSNTSSIGRRGVGGGATPMTGTRPTRTRTCGVAVCPISVERIWRLAGTAS